jgi:hypothetical protein
MPLFPDPNDDTTTLNPGVGGDVMDVSDVGGDFDVLTGFLRERIVIGGEKRREALAEVVAQDPGVAAYGLPVRIVDDPQTQKLLSGILCELQGIRAILTVTFGKR